MRQFMDIVNESVDRWLKEDRKGPTKRTTKYRYLYHLTDHHGFAYSVEQNVLRSLRYSYVSTTYNPNMRTFVGGQHTDFKFILNGPKLAKTYGVFNYDFHAWYSDGTRRSLNEFEIGINTRSIEPLREFCEGLDLLFPLFSQSGIQWLMYDNPKTNYLFDVPKSAAPRGIEALETVMNVWKVPVTVDKRPMTNQEKDFIARVLEIHRSGGNFRLAMRRLVREFPILDHMGEELNRATVIRLQLGDKITDLFNKYFQNRYASDVKPDEVRALVMRAARALRLNPNWMGHVLAHAEKKGMFHPAIPVVEWSIVFRHLIYNDYEGAMKAIDYVTKRNEWTRERFDSKEIGANFIHAGTAFPSM